MSAAMPLAGAPADSTRTMVRERMLVEDVDDNEVPLTVEEEALLLRQCRLNKVELVEKTIDSGKIGPNFVFSNGDTVLIIACKCGYKKLADMLHGTSSIGTPLLTYTTVHVSLPSRTARTRWGSRAT